MDIAPFRNLLNDMYAKDISKKIQASLLSLQKSGCFVGQKAPYGYIKDPNDKHHLLIDERYAPIVRRIFSMYVDEGIGCHTIAKIFTQERIPRPFVAAAKEMPCFERFDTDESKSYTWTNHQVNTIIRNPVYAGHIKAQNRPTMSIKSKKHYPKGSQSFIVPNVHDPIIPSEKWELAQKMLSANRHAPVNDGYDNIFTGLLKCADCGRTLSMKRVKFKTPRPDPIDHIRYYCVQYRNFGSTGCSLHRIDARDLQNAVLADIRRLARYAIDHDEKMVKDIISKLHSDVSDNTKKTEQEIRKAKKRLSELDKMFSALYEDKVNGNITERNYKQLASSYESEQLELEKQIGEYEEKIRNAKVEQENADYFVDMIKEYAGITELNAAVLHTLIDKIVVHEADIIQHERIQKIEIYYNFVGRFDEVPDEA